jgi:hypothetical protein
MLPNGYTYHPAPYMTSQPLPGQGRGMLNAVGDVANTGLSMLGGLGVSPQTQALQRNAIGGGTEALQKLMGYTDESAKLGGRMAKAALYKNPLLRAGMKFGGPLAAGFAVGDILLGEESLGNKAMDTAFMVGGGALGSVVPVVGTALGAGLGKAASDAVQFIGGGGKSAEQRKMEEALAALRGGQI